MMHCSNYIGFFPCWPWQTSRERGGGGGGGGGKEQARQLCWSLRQAREVDSTVLHRAFQWLTFLPDTITASLVKGDPTV